MASQQFVAYATEAAEVEQVLRREIAKSQDAQRPLSFFAVAPLHHAHETHLGQVVKRILAGSNSRHGADWIVQERPNYSYFVVLGADLPYTLDIAGQVQDECVRVGLKISGSAMYLPKNGTVDDKAREIYGCLSNGIEDHRRKLPIIFPEEFK